MAGGCCSKRRCRKGLRLGKGVRLPGMGGEPFLQCSLESARLCRSLTDPREPSLRVGLTWSVHLDLSDRDGFWQCIQVNWRLSEAILIS